MLMPQCETEVDKELEICLLEYKEERWMTMFKNTTGSRRRSSRKKWLKEMAQESSQREDFS
jgi:hypothetical protein